MGLEVVFLILLAGGIVLLVTGHAVLGIIALALSLGVLAVALILTFVVGKAVLGVVRHVRGRHDIAASPHNLA